MPDAATDDPILIVAREFLAVERVVGIVRRPIGITFHANGGNRDRRSWRQLRFQGVVLRFAFHKSLAPAVVVDNDIDVVGVVESRRRTIEGRVIKVPLWRGEPPDQL
jgi:hypothetical protein